MSSQPQALPQETFDNIIDHFHSDTAALQTCALVSPAWLSSARAHLFHRISLDPPKYTRGAGSFFTFTVREAPCQKLLATIERSLKSRLGSIAPFVRELRLCEGMRAREWLAYEPTLPLLLRALTNLHRFEIGRSASMRIAWGQLPRSLKEAIQANVLSLPSLTELELGSLMLDNLGDMKRLLGACKHLRVLEVDHVIFADESMECLKSDKEDVDEWDRAERTSLDKLVIGPRTSTAFISCLLHRYSTVDVGTIRRLSISISGNFADFARLLHASISVERLEMVLMNDIDLQEYWDLLPSCQFDLSQVPYLRNLKVNIDVLQKMDDPLPWLSAVLQTGVDTSHPTRPNMIQTIWIVYSLYLPAPYMDRSANTSIFDRWSDIDAILCGTVPGMDFEPGRSTEYPHAYENLETVKLDFMLENPIGFGIAPRFMKELVLDSPGLEERHVLKINAFDTSK